MREYELKNNIIGFYNGIYSQWFMCSIDIDNGDWVELLQKYAIKNIVTFYTHFDDADMPYSRKFNCAEQAMMFGKAIVFGDWENALKVLTIKHPRDQKALGRKIKDFNEEEWNKVKFHLVSMINQKKFEQNFDLATELESTGHALIVEMSQPDKIWGIGYYSEEDNAWDVAKWNGENLLGRAIMRVRENLRNP